MHKKIILSLVPFLLFFAGAQSLFVDYDVIPPDPISLAEGADLSRVEDMKPTVEMKPGIWFRLDYISFLIDELESEVLPIDTEPEESVDKLKRILIGQRILFFLILFYMALCFSAFASHLYRAWFYLTLNRIVFWLGLFWSLQLFFLHTQVLKDGNLWGLAGIIYFLSTFVLTILALIYLEKGKKETKTFETLKHSAALEEEGRAPEPTSNGSYLKLFSHFLIIIAVGVLIGNFVYIPLFLLQKHYVTEFTMFIFSLIVLLSGFYIYNYGKVGGEKSLSKWQNTMVSIAYLQFRFLRNGFFGIFATILVVFFVTFLFSILLLNIDLIQSNTGLFQKGTEF